MSDNQTTPRRCENGKPASEGGHDFQPPNEIFQTCAKCGLCIPIGG
jgi:hypothetical protein